MNAENRLSSFHKNAERRDIARAKLAKIREQIQQLSEQADQFETSLVLLDTVHYGHIGDLAHFSDEIAKAIAVGRSCLDESDPEDYDFDL